MKRIMASSVDPGRVAAFIVEPMQGEGGFNVAPKAFLEGLREIADQHGILLILDEIQTGIARTGKMLALEHYGVQPDLVTMAKGLGGGFPLSAVTGRKEIVDAPNPGGLGGTYAGPPISVAASHAVLDVIEEENLCARAAEIGKIMTDRLQSIAARQGMECIGDVRGLGAMVAFELVADRASKEADAALTADLMAEAERRGVLLLNCGTKGNVIRPLTPLTIPMDQLEEALDVLEASLEAVVSARRQPSGHPRATARH